MSFTEQQVRLAARMYEMRDTARSLHGENYAAVLSPWKLLIRAVMKRTGKDCLDAVLAFVNETEISPEQTLLLIAAAVEITEEGSAAAV